jgi:chemotaxis protein methyltransferase CheR
MTRTAKLSPKEFNKLSNFIYTHYGIKMPPTKRLMLEGRLSKRLSANGMDNYEDYVEFVFSREGMRSEMIHMIDVVTTNKTDFFREPIHFEFLQGTAFPALKEKYGGRRQVNIWSAGCSSGEEPYTIALTASEYAAANSPFPFHITATDVSSRILNHAQNAVYKAEKLANVPIALKRKYMLKSKEALKPTIRMNKHLRAKLSFQRMNFMDDHYNTHNNFDIIFCRNVIIYFDRDTQERVINKLCSKLNPGGYFFLGHSESLSNMQAPLKHIRPTIFQKI